MCKFYRKLTSALLTEAITKQKRAQEEIAYAIPGSYYDELGKLRLAIADTYLAIVLALDPGT